MKEDGEMTLSRRFKRRSAASRGAGQLGACAQPREPAQRTFPACAGARKRTESVEGEGLDSNGSTRFCSEWWQLVFGIGTRGDSSQVPSHPHLVRGPHGQGLGKESRGRSGREREV